MSDMNDYYWIDVDWPDPYDTSGDPCVYVYCSRPPKCDWRQEACGHSFSTLHAIAADHEAEAHGG